jgi:hypothetical protein
VQRLLAAPAMEVPDDPTDRRLEFEVLRGRNA